MKPESMKISSIINRRADQAARRTKKTTSEFYPSPVAACHKICLILVVCFASSSTSARGAERRASRGQRSDSNNNGNSNNVVAEMQVICRSDSILLKVDTSAPFNGMIYAKEAPSGSNCMTEYSSSTNLTFRLPLKSCGTLFAEADDGVEYFNTVIVQPHMRLMTNQGKGYHIRCKYQTRERTIANTHFNVSASFPMQSGLGPQSTTTPLLATASMPSCTMKIFRSGSADGGVAETVRIGDKLIMVIEIDQQDMYGMRITNCVVRDGMNVAEQQLINDSGCPIDETIMPRFDYTNNYTRAAVAFPAHKFPHTGSVYYQCNVRLCIAANGGCNPAECAGSGSGSGAGGGGGSGQPQTGGPDSSQGGPRRRRRMAAEHDESPRELPAAPEARRSPAAALSFDVYSGLYVSDPDVGESSSADPSAKLTPALSAATTARDEEAQRMICMTLGQMSPIILVGSLAIVATVFMLLCQIGLFGRADRARSADEKSPSRSFVGLTLPARDESRHQSRSRRLSNQCSSIGSSFDCRQAY